MGIQREFSSKKYYEKIGVKTKLQLGYKSGRKHDLQTLYTSTIQ
jgi:hypothetical protein